LATKSLTSLFVEGDDPISDEQPTITDPLATARQSSTFVTIRAVSSRKLIGNGSPKNR
jgi:hypothetical protein